MHGPTLTLSIHPSRWLRTALALLHLLAAAAVLLAYLAVWVQAVLLIAVAASLGLHLRPRPSLEIRCEADGRLLLQKDGDWQVASLQPATMVTPWLSALQFRLGESRRTRTLAILPDSLPADDFRRLRVWLKWKAHVAGGKTADAIAEP